MNQQNSPFEFHSANTAKLREGEEILRGMLNRVLERFHRNAPANLRRGQATSEMAVFPAGPREYYAVILIGPCENLETVDNAIVATARELVPNARKIGIK